LNESESIMKFMAIGTHPPAEPGAPVNRKELEENLEYFRGGLGNGQFDCVYVMAGGGRLVIANFDSEEALRASLAEPPDTPERVWQITALRDFEAAIGQFLASLPTDAAS
jgi:hypothetical protein